MFMKMLQGAKPEWTKQAENAYGRVLRDDARSRIRKYRDELINPSTSSGPLKPYASQTF
ncbi:unnamed protein product [Gulo gulo]|uniref:Uncharacterized protein n=1 Tax=Gulo gulo TaxID=48420 RepID=A0A9X9LJ84_GULGU|nr:unnamed protein product [Gulo gulo]